MKMLIFKYHLPYKDQKSDFLRKKNCVPFIFCQKRIGTECQGTKYLIVKLVSLENKTVMVIFMSVLIGMIFVTMLVLLQKTIFVSQ